jgi:hypothetical protein
VLWISERCWHRVINAGIHGFVAGMQSGGNKENKGGKYWLFVNVRGNKKPGHAPAWRELKTSLCLLRNFLHTCPDYAPRIQLCLMVSPEFFPGDEAIIVCVDARKGFMGSRFQGGTDLTQ